jgi:LysM repeat protein
LFVEESKADEVFEKSYQYCRSVVSNAVGEERLSRLSAPQRALLVDAAFRRPRFVSDNAEELGSALDHAASTGDWSPVVSILSQLGQGPGQEGRSRDVALQIVPLAALGTHTLGVRREEPSVPLDYHVVVEGETLGELAPRLGLSVQELKILNGLSDDDIRAGQPLFFPQLPPLRPGASAR